MLPVEAIRRVGKFSGRTEAEILRAQANYFALPLGKERDEYLHSLMVTIESIELMKMLEDKMDIQYDEKGKAIGVCLK